MTTKLYRVRLLKVMRTPDAMHWTAKHVGEYVPLLGHSPDSYSSRQPNGIVSFLPEECARVVRVFVAESKLSEYPYKYAITDSQATYRTPDSVIAGLAKQQGCAASCDRMGICQALDDCQDQHRIDAATKKPNPFSGLFSKLLTPKARRGWYEIDELREVKKQRDQLLEASLRLAKRGWFQPNSCADTETLRDMEAMRAAIVVATGRPT